MSKFKLMFFSVIAAGILLSMSSVTANAQLSQKAVDSLTPKYRAQGPCSDPWVTIAIGDVFANTRAINGIGRYGDCDPQRYANGSWSSYNELYQGVKTAFDNMSGKVTTTKTSQPNGTWKIVTDAGSGFVATQLLSHDGSSLIGMSGSTIVASGAGNFSGLAITDGNEKRIKLGKSVLIIKKR